MQPMDTGTDSEMPPPPPVARSGTVHADFATAGAFKTIVDALKDLVSQCTIEFCPEQGMCIRSLDASHVAMIVLALRPTHFARFVCPRACTVGMRITALVTMCKAVDKGQGLHIEYALDGDKIVFARMDAQGRAEAQYELHLMNIDEVAVQPPAELPVDALVTLPSAAFEKTVRDVRLFGDTLEVCVLRGRGVTTFGADGEHGRVTVVVEHTAHMPDGCALGVVEDAEEDAEALSSARLSLKFVSLFAKAAGLAAAMVLGIGERSPAVFHFPLPDGGSGLTFYLAPKCDEDDECDEDKCDDSQE